MTINDTVKNLVDEGDKNFSTNQFSEARINYLNAIRAIQSLMIKQKGISDQNWRDLASIQMRIIGLPQNQAQQTLSHQDVLSTLNNIPINHYLPGDWHIRAHIENNLGLLSINDLEMAYGWYLKALYSYQQISNKTPRQWRMLYSCYVNAAYCLSIENANPNYHQAWIFRRNAYECLQQIPIHERIAEDIYNIQNDHVQIKLLEGRLCFEFSHKYKIGLGQYPGFFPQPLSPQTHNYNTAIIPTLALTRRS